MISSERVKEYLASVSGLSSTELERYIPLISNAITSAENQFEDSSTDLAVMYAAAKANYDIALAMSAEDRITSFTAGDVSITEDNSRLESARALYESVFSDCTSSVTDRGFVFKTV